MKRVIAVLLVGSALGLAALRRRASRSPTSGGGRLHPRRRRRHARSDEGAAGAAPSVAIKGFAFAPQTIKAKVGEKITWTNDDAAPHTVTAKSGGELDSGTIAQGASFSFTPREGRARSRTSARSTRA